MTLPLAAVLATALVAGCESPPDTSVFPSAQQTDVTVEQPDVTTTDAATDAAEDVAVIEDAADTTVAEVTRDIGPEDIEADSDTWPDDVEDTSDGDTSGCPLPCQNDSVCNPEAGECICTGDFTGVDCSSPVIPCERPCQNDGICSSEGICSCSEGWTGDSCETPVCGTNGCLNGGVCVAPERCECPRAWMGRLCDIDAPPLRVITGGSLLMGSPANEIGRNGDFEGQTAVTLTYKYEIMKFEMTQLEWRALFDGQMPDGQSYDKDAAPVANLTWWSALQAANVLSRMHGLSPCYSIPPSSNCAPTSTAYALGVAECGDTVTPNISAPDKNILLCEGYRLPTEAEWEFAARAGTTTGLYGPPTAGAELAANSLDCRPGTQPALEPIAWWCGSATSVSLIALKEPNNLQLYDVLGNVSEWAWDNFARVGLKDIDPHRDDSRTWVDANATIRPPARTIRGGAYSSPSPRFLRLGSREPMAASARSPGVGLRLVRTLDTP